MTLRSTSNKFSLPSFRRQPSESNPTSPQRTNGYHDDESNSPSSGLDGLGRKLGKTIAHQTLLPGLGNRDLRALQDVIASEKGVLQVTEKLAIETAKSASSLPIYGTQEGPDLRDVLTHSSTLLSQLSTALHVFTDHQHSLRTAYKRIRQREEELDELKRRRRTTGAKAEQAEKKLAKMGPENKGLPSQTELLERLRGEMRGMDTEIYTEETRLGDFKRQSVKEALSFKFGGLEELGEKMCIIGELGKLLLEEVPLEETPAGYGRAPYMGYERTENAVNEATKCLATVRFNAGSSSPKAPGLPPHNPSDPLSAPSIPRNSESAITAAEAYANYPGGNEFASPTLPSSKGKSRDFTMESNPYDGISNPYTTNAPASEVVWQSPNDDITYPSTTTGHGRKGSDGGVHAHDYEYEQARQLEAEEAAWRAGQESGAGHGTTYQALATRQDTDQSEVEAGPAPDEAYSHVTINPNGATEEVPTRDLKSPWEPLNVKRDHEHDQSIHSISPRPTTQTLPDPLATLGQPLPVGEPELRAYDVGHTSPVNGDRASPPTSIDLPPPPNVFSENRIGGGIGGGGAQTGMSERDGFYTPLETNIQLPDTQTQNSSFSHPPPPPPPPPPAPAQIDIPQPVTYPSNSVTSPTITGTGTGGKISAAAFRRGAKPRGSTDPEDVVGYGGGVGGGGGGQRRLPVPPMSPSMGRVGESGAGMEKRDSAQGFGEVGREREGQSSPPPDYGYDRAHGEGSR